MKARLSGAVVAGEEALEREVDAALRGVHQAVELLRGEAEVGAEEGAGAGEDLLARGGEPADDGRAVDAVHRGEALEGDAAQKVQAKEGAVAVEERASGPESPALALHHHNVAGVLRLLGRATDARARYERALELEIRALGPNDPKVGLTENSLGVLALEGGELPEARRRFERARTILGERAQPDRALALFNLGRVAARERRHRDAIPLFTEALEVTYATLGADHPRAWDVLLERSASQRALGDAAGALVDLEAARKGAATLADESLEARDVLRRIEEARRPPPSRANPRPDATPRPKGAPPSTAGYGPAQP